MKQRRLVANRDQEEFRQLGHGYESMKHFGEPVGGVSAAPKPQSHYTPPTKNMDIAPFEFDSPEDRQGHIDSISDYLDKNKKKIRGGVKLWESSVENLADEELHAITNRNVQGFLNSYQNVLRGTFHGESLVEAAHAGRIKRGWYQDTVKAFSKLFPDPDDYSRFMALLSATSPQTGVDTNFKYALDIWTEWNQQGREARTPEDVKKLVRGALDKWKSQGKQVQMGDGGSVPQAVPFSPASSLPNIVRTLGYQGDWSDFRLSGPKVQSFWSNLIGNANRSTNDVWMSYLSKVPQKTFGTTPSYYSFNTVARNAVDALNDRLLPDEKPWTLAEVQETSWSFLRALAYVQGAKGLNPNEALAEITNGDITGNVDFLKLAAEDHNVRRRLHTLGLGAELDAVREIYEGVSQDKGQEASTRAVESPNSVLESISAEAGRRSGGFKSGRTKLRSRGRVVRYQNDATLLPPSSAQESGLVETGEGDHWTAFSPNTDEDLTFDEAWKRLNSANQKVARSLSEDMLHAAQVQDYKLFDGVGDWEDGAENSLVYVLPKADAQLSKYLAAWHGLVTNQKAVLHFESQGEGPDSMYQMSVPISSVAEVRAKLAKFSIPFRTIIPRGDKNVVLVYDQQRGMYDNVSQFVEEVDGTVREARGRGEFIGSSSRNPSRTDARRVYRDIISKYESKSSPSYQSPDQGPELADNPGAHDHDPAGDQQASLRAKGRVVRYQAEGESPLAQFTSPEGNVPMYHYSSINNDELFIDPKHFGRNRYTQNEKQAAKTPRSFFYADLKDKEQTFFRPGTPLYQTELPASKIYDLSRDPEAFMQGPVGMDDVLRNIKEAGYSAVYYNNGMHVISSLEPLKARRIDEEQTFRELGLDTSAFTKKEEESFLPPPRYDWSAKGYKVRRQSQGRVVRLDARKAPEGGMAWRGMYYPGGSYIPNPSDNAPIQGLGTQPTNPKPMASQKGRKVKKGDKTTISETGEEKPPVYFPFVPARPGKPGKDEPIDVDFEVQSKTPPHRDEYHTESIMEAFEKSLASNSNQITEEQAKKYQATFREVVDQVSSTARDRIYQNFTRAELFPSPNYLTQQALRYWPSLKGAGMIGGIYVGGQLWLDGDYAEGTGGPEMVPEESYIGNSYTRGGVAGQTVTRTQIYTHELAHAVDGNLYDYSSQPSWDTAFKNGIANGNLSEYARTDASEAFAEFFRAVHTPEISTQDLKKYFPLSMAFFKKNHLLPKSRTTRQRRVKNG